MNKRSEEQMVSMEPVKVRFGAHDYKIPLLFVTAQAEWRAKLLQEMQPVVASFIQDISAPGAMDAGLAQALLESPKIMTDMLFEYAPDLPREEILKKTTEEQLAVAFSALLQVVFPFRTPLSTLTAIMMKNAVSLR